MKFEFLWDPFIIIIRDVFTEKENKEILAEAVSNKKKFEESVIGAGKDKKFRNNIVAYYTMLYYTMSYYIILYHIMSYSNILCHIIYHIISLYQRQLVDLEQDGSDRPCS